MVRNKAVTWILLAVIAAAPWKPAEAAAGAQGEAAFRYNSTGKRDPFVALVRDGKIIAPVSLPTGGARSSADMTLPALAGILWDPGGNSIALIDDTEAQVGDQVRGYRIEEITKDAVILSGGGKLVTLRLSFEEPKAGMDGSGGGEGP